MDKIIILTNASRRFEPLARFITTLFPECDVEMQTEQTWNSEAGPRNAGAGQAGKIREGAANEVDSRKIHGD